jgi:hypothetical protein
MVTYPHLSLNEIPTSLPAFIALRDQLAQTPEGGAVIIVLALYLYAHAPESELGQHALIIAVDRSRLRETTDGYQGWGLLAIDFQRIQRQLRDYPWIPRSYILGTDPQNGYRVSDPPFQFEISNNVHSGDPALGVYKVFVRSSGAASPRPVTLKRNNRGLWKAREYSSLLMGLVPPKKSVDDDL